MVAPAWDWAGLSVTVTGGAGFLGRAVCRKLRERGAREIFVPRRAEYDLTTEADAERLYRDSSPDVVLHLAAEVGGIGADRANPGRYFFANLAMGMHLIEHGRRQGLRKFVQIGTICSYPKLTPVPFREEDLWSGYPEPTNAPYGVAKKALLVMLQSYRAQYGFPGIYLLPVNLYGPGDNFDPATSHVIPALVRKFDDARRTGAPFVTLWGSGAASREFLYVDDAAEGILLATERYEDCEPVNLGTGEEIRIRDLAARIQRLIGYEGEIRWDTSKPDGQPRRQLNIDRAWQRFAFRARTPFHAGLEKTIEWWQSAHPDRAAVEGQAG
jgi:GDP-L-fucose synthase